VHDLQDVFNETRDQHFTSPVERRDVLLSIERVALVLEQLLVEGGSVWAVSLTGPHWGLVRRVNETTRALIDRASSPATDAARKIAFGMGRLLSARTGLRPRLPRRCARGRGDCVTRRDP
jgi:hypothetical protein